MAILTELQEEEAAMKTFDVFLSFRGKDTRLNFTDHLYQALLNENISTFLDEEEVETGEELKPELAKAIKTSRASIIVLSKNYATSTWCLDELVMILEQRRKSSNHVVLPIFYHVEPTHVRKQEGSFGEALFEHRKRIEKEKDDEKRTQGFRKLELWAKALTKVTDLKGKDANGRESVLVEETIREISSRLNLHMQDINPHLIGMDISVSTISSWLKESSSKANAEVLTIWGMAGIGKTTLAKYVYMLHRREFERSSFIEDIERRYAQQSYAILHLQNQLLVDLLKKSMIEEHNVEVCTSKIEKVLAKKQTLIVLDGVDNFEQVDMLIGTKSFHPGSKIIITTKDGSVTERCALFRVTFPPKHTKHALHGISETESLRLLCLHAFGGYGLKEGYEKEVTRASKYCGGHPLALKVLGSSLINKDVATWNDILEMLETGEFHTHVHKVLQISFDSLPSENCKELFKHIACFFVGNDKKLTEAILKECGFRTSYGIDTLINRCLLTIDKRNTLKMHQLLQEMGRDLVRQESPEKPWKRSRVWNHEESLNLLKQDKGTTKIQGLVLDMRILEKETLHRSSGIIKNKFQEDLSMNFGVFPSVRGVPISSSSPSKKFELRTNALIRMDKLHILQLNHVKLKGSYKNFPQGLRVLCMHGFELKYIPSGLPMEKLVALDMSYSNLKQLWKKPKLLGSLKYLNLSYSKLVTVGGFVGLPALETLILKGCGSLIHVCESIGGCDSLVLLDMSYCNKLKDLPRGINKLKNVKFISLDGWLGAGEFENSKSLLISCLPSSLVNLSLRSNNLSNESFPKDFSSMPLLKRLYLDNNPIDFLPDCVKSLSMLEVLSVAQCKMLKSVLCPPITIKSLHVHNCSRLEKITFCQEMLALPFVEYENARSLKELEGIFKIQALEHIDDHILRSLGWANLKYLQDHKMHICDSYIWEHAKKLSILMYYEFGIFSTCFPGKEIPDWLTHKSNGKSVSFSIPSPSSMNKRIEGINICFVHTFSSTRTISCLRTKVHNITKNRTWIYYGYVYAVLLEGVDQGMVWLSHWMFSNNEIEYGDEIGVSIVEEEEDGANVKECGISLVCKDIDKEDNSLNYYKSWKHIIGGDLSTFQLTSGDYFMCHARFFRSASRFIELFQHKTSRNLFGYIPQYKDQNVDVEKFANTLFLQTKPSHFPNWERGNSAKVLYLYETWTLMVDYQGKNRQEDTDGSRNQSPVVAFFPTCTRRRF